MSLTRSGKLGHVLSPDDPIPVGRRIRAAMRLAGIDSIEELAERINTKNLGTRTLRKIADDTDTSREATWLDVVAIAHATGLPEEFFTHPADELLAGIRGEKPTGEVVERLSALEESLSSLRMELARTALVRAAQAGEASPQRTGGLPDEGHHPGPAEGHGR